ncbi:hypothetical protein HMPREF9554_02379 [Treponema phagedenis F0421]|nr:hypothetical protein HMPREF9554_02379 [Treponema phagedenis F0421]
MSHPNVNAYFLSPKPRVPLLQIGKIKNIKQNELGNGYIVMEE